MIAEISSEVIESANSNSVNPHENHNNISKNFDVKELEMLLEPYFVQIDGTLNNVSTVCNSILPLNFLFGFHFL